MSYGAYIPVYNGEATIEAAVRSLLGQTPPPAQVWVVDDASTDGTRLRVSGLPVRLRAQARNGGIGCARNAGVAGLEGCEFVAAIDADVVLAPDWAGTMIEELRDPAVAGAGGMLVEAGGDLASSWRRVHMPQHWGPERLGNPRFLFGSNTLFRRSELVDAGLYGEQFRTNNEDVDLSARLLARGRRLVYNPAARAEHLKRSTLAGLLENLWQWYEHKHADERPFDSPENLCRRVGKVNFGIFRYKLEKDLSLGLDRHLAVDLLVPFYLTLRDLSKTFGLQPGLAGRERAARTARAALSRAAARLETAPAFSLARARWAAGLLSAALGPMGEAGRDGGETCAPLLEETDRLTDEFLLGLPEETWRRIARSVDELQAERPENRGGA